MFKLCLKLDLDKYINFKKDIINYVFIIFNFTEFQWDSIEVIFEIFFSKKLLNAKKGSCEKKYFPLFEYIKNFFLKGDEEIWVM